MPLLQVHERNQITLPKEVLDFLHVQPRGQVEYKFLPDGVLIFPKTPVVKEDKLAKIRRLSKAGRGVFRSADEVDMFINQLRAE